MTNSRTTSVEPRPLDHASQTLEQTIRQELHLFIRETFLQLRPSLIIGDTDDLVEKGVLDSLAFVELITEIQNRYNVTIQDIDVIAENFGTVAAMARYVSERNSR
jgi:acyl carrier protein